MSIIPKNKGKMGRPLFVVVSNTATVDPCSLDYYSRFAKTIGHYYLTKRSAILAMRKEAERKRREVVASAADGGHYRRFREALEMTSMTVTEYADKKLVEQIDMVDSHEIGSPEAVYASFGVDNIYCSIGDLAEYEVFCWSVHQLSEAPDEVKEEEEAEEEEEEREDDGDGDE